MIATTRVVGSNLPDSVSQERRSAIMRAVRSRHTGPELAIRKELHRMGLRFRLHRSDLPGKPDLVLAKWRTAVFVNGCFWHQHSGCRRATLPRTNAAFWRAKLGRNLLRDQQNYKSLSRSGWNVLVVWECEIKAGKSSLLLERYFRRIRRLKAKSTNTRIARL